MDFLKELFKYKDDIIKHTMELVRIPSELVENEEYNGKVYRFGYQNKLALDYFLKLAESLGFETKNIEDVCGHVEFGGSDNDEIFACLCHLDVVPAIGNWKNPPYEPWIEDGKIYGRGTQDDKGPAVVSLYALKVLKDLGFKPSRRIRLIVGTDEESGSRGLHRYLEVEEKPSMGISPDADFPLIYGEKGIASFDVVCKNTSNIKAKGGVRYNVVAPWVKFSGDMNFDDVLALPRTSKDGSEYVIEGKSAHAMEPDNGINAIKEFALYMNNKIDNNFIKFICDNLINTRLKQMNLDITSHDMGDLTMNMGMLSMDEECRLGINIRYPNNMVFEEFIEKFKAKALSYGVNVEVLGNVVPHYIDPNSEYIQTLYASYKKYTNDDAKMKTIGGGTYARDIKNGVAFGVLFPDDEEVAHEVNEYINIDKLIKAGAIITDAIYSVNK